MRDRQLDAARRKDFRLVAIAWELQGDRIRKETSKGSLQIYNERNPTWTFLRTIQDA